MHALGHSSWFRAPVPQAYWLIEAIREHVRNPFHQQADQSKPSICVRKFPLTAQLVPQQTACIAPLGVE